MPDPTDDDDQIGEQGQAGGEGHGLYAPDAVEATRMREKGLGVGEEDLQLQRDPGGATTTDEFRKSTGTSAEDEEPPVAERPSDRRH
ncbi:MAG: hypothetical protein JSR45_04995 [Proteobacteria bacterium]|nr:hypothetical protein [Pseudomonadota bacterium]